jgi:hypothetical protein
MAIINLCLKNDSIDILSITFSIWLVWDKPPLSDFVASVVNIIYSVVLLQAWRQQDSGRQMARLSHCTSRDIYHVSGLPLREQMEKKNAFK